MLAPLSQQLRNETKTTQGLLMQVFQSFVLAMGK